jgi:hypothetical protein
VSSTPNQPAFALELVPVADVLPTWTGAVIAVLALRNQVEGSFLSFLHFRLPRFIFLFLSPQRLCS